MKRKTIKLKGINSSIFYSHHKVPLNSTELCIKGVRQHFHPPGKVQLLLQTKYRTLKLPYYNLDTQSTSLFGNADFKRKTSCLCAVLTYQSPLLLIIKVLSESSMGLKSSIIFKKKESHKLKKLEKNTTVGQGICGILVNAFVWQVSKVPASQLSLEMESTRKGKEKSKNIIIKFCVPNSST